MQQNKSMWLHSGVLITQNVTRNSLIPAAVTTWTPHNTDLRNRGHYCCNCSIILQRNYFACTAVMCITDKRKQTTMLIHYTWRNTTTSPADNVFSILPEYGWYVHYIDGSTNAANSQYCNMRLFPTLQIIFSFFTLLGQTVWRLRCPVESSWINTYLSPRLVVWFV
jgi:hypothetical protein